MSTLPEGTHVAEVALTVADLPGELAFYEDRLGLQVIDQSDGEVALGAGDLPFLRLFHDPGAPSARGTAGLYHFAVLYPSRKDLAEAVRRLVRRRWPLQGASDHLVSEAIYLADPERNGIELYRDRPRAEWARDGGGVRMATLPLDLEELLGDAAAADGAAPAGTRMGHIHLHVRDLPEAARF